MTGRTGNGLEAGPPELILRGCEIQDQVLLVHPYFVFFTDSPHCTPALVPMWKNLLRLAMNDDLRNTGPRGRGPTVQPASSKHMINLILGTTREGRWVKNGVDNRVGQCKSRG